MSDPVISVQNLSKLYRIGAKEDSNKTFREAIIDGLTAPIRNFRRLNRLTKFDDSKTKLNSSNAMRSTPCPMPSSEEDVIWALKDVSFEVQPGEIVGIIGRNGAGKTTLLKILSRITEPSEGAVDLTGRVTSLLEVGTGFHPELTGRENIFLNGTILGMKKREIEKKFDEIVNFSEIGKFIDTPVKRYSSGMYVRLAFAVASHLEPEILMIDEVLAVGDISFQKKCLGKMEQISHRGRTVIFVSHNLAAVSNLCNKGILLDSGKLIFFGDIRDCTEYYLEKTRMVEDLNSPETAIEQLPSDNQFILNSISLTQNGKKGSEFFSHEPIKINIEYEVLEDIDGLRVGFNLYSGDGIHVFRSHDNDSPLHRLLTRHQGKYVSEGTIPGNLLTPGSYKLSFDISIHYVRWIVKDEIATKFSITKVDGVSIHYPNEKDGIITPLLDWKVSSF